MNFKSSYLRSISVVLSGNVLAQLIPILVMPLLTRIYGPEDFGVYALYITGITVMAVLATGKYENALLLIKSEKALNGFAKLCIYNAVLVSIMIFLVLLIFSDSIVSAFNIDHSLIYYVPIGGFSFAVFNILTIWFSRRGEFTVISLNRVLQNLFISISQAVLPFIYKFSGAILVADVIGRAVAIIFITSKFLQKAGKGKVKRRYLAYFNKYKKLPMYEAPAELSNIMAFQLPFILIPFYFSPYLSGLYFLVYRVVMAPVSMIGSAIGEVFRAKASHLIRDVGECKSLFVKTAVSLFALGIIPCLILTFFAEDIFVFVFGEKWAEAGVFASILAPLALLRLVSAPLSYMFILREKFSLDLAVQFANLVCSAVAIMWAGSREDIDSLLVLICTVGSTFYIIQLSISFKLSLKVSASDRTELFVR